MGATRLVQLYKKKGGDEYEVLETVKGEALKGKRYVPLFEYFRAEAAAPHFAFRVLTDAYVTDADGMWPKPPPPPPSSSPFPNTHHFCGKYANLCKQLI